jgi:hypothetical protein
MSQYNNTPFSVTLNGDLFAGTVTAAGSTIANIININSIISNPNAISANKITLPNKKNHIILTSSNNGYINDPLFFDNFGELIGISGQDTLSIQGGESFTYNPGNGILSFNGGTIKLVNISITVTADSLPPGTLPLITDVTQQGLRIAPTTNQTVNTSFISNNIEEIISDTQKSYDISLMKLKINTNCGG